MVEPALRRLVQRIGTEWRALDVDARRPYTAMAAAARVAAAAATAATAAAASAAAESSASVVAGQAGARGVVGKPKQRVAKPRARAAAKPTTRGWRAKPAAKPPSRRGALPPPPLNLNPSPAVVVEAEVLRQGNTVVVEAQAAEFTETLPPKPLAMSSKVVPPLKRRAPRVATSVDGATKRSPPVKRARK
eukprot:SAG11_NODE_1627_length_4552_cov_4.548619_1_plen_190_part_00